MKSLVSPWRWRQWARIWFLPRKLRTSTWVLWGQRQENGAILSWPELLVTAGTMVHDYFLGNRYRPHGGEGQWSGLGFSPVGHLKGLEDLQRRGWNKATCTQIKRVQGMGLIVSPWRAIFFPSLMCWDATENMTKRKFGWLILLDLFTFLAGKNKINFGIESLFIQCDNTGGKTWRMTNFIIALFGTNLKLNMTFRNIIRDSKFV